MGEKRLTKADLDAEVWIITTRKEREEFVAKGSQYERDICRQLGDWWMGEKTDDLIFWRSANSGGMATVRKKKGKRTAGHQSDITATDHRGTGFTSAVCLEIKRGYAQLKINDILDRPIGGATSLFQQWLDQVEAAQANSGAPFWMIIHKRDRREEMVYIPFVMSLMLREAGALEPMPIPSATFQFLGSNGEYQAIYCCKLRTLLKRVQPFHIHRIAAEDKANAEHFGVNDYKGGSKK